MGTGGDVAGAIVVNDGGTLLPGTPTAARHVNYTGGLSITSTTAGATKVGFKLNQNDTHTLTGISDQINPTSLTVTGNPVTVNLVDWGRLEAGTYTLIAANVANLNDWILPSRVGDYLVAKTTTGASLQAQLTYSPNYWNDASTDGKWATPGNWSGGDSARCQGERLVHGNHDRRDGDPGRHRPHDQGTLFHELRGRRRVVYDELDRREVDPGCQPRQCRNRRTRGHADDRRSRAVERRRRRHGGKRNHADNLRPGDRRGQDVERLRRRHRRRGHGGQRQFDGQHRPRRRRGAKSVGVATSVSGTFAGGLAVSAATTIAAGYSGNATFSGPVTAASGLTVTKTGAGTATFSGTVNLPGATGQRLSVADGTLALTGAANTIGGTIGVEAPGVLVGGSKNDSATSAALGGPATQIVLNGGRMKLTPLGAGVDIVNATPALAGSAVQSAGAWTVTGSGNDIWNLADSFHYLAAQMTGDFSVSADLTLMIPSTNTWTKGGIMARETLAAGSKFFLLVDTNGAAGGAGHEIAAQWRDASDAACGSFYGATSPSNNGHQLRIKIERSAGTFKAFTAPLTDPNNWSPYILDAANGTTHADTMTSSTIYVGLAVTSHEAAQTATATFSNLQGFAPFETQTTDYGNDVRVAAYGSVIEAGSTAELGKLVMDPNVLLEIAGGTIVFKGQTTLDGYSTLKAGGGDLVLAGNVTGAAGTSLTKDGAGTLTIAGAPQYPGDTTVSAGKLIYQLATGGSPTVGGASKLLINAGATVEAKGTADPFTDATTPTQHAAVENYGNFHVMEGAKTVASIAGTGATTVDGGASLLTGAIVQDTLSIGAGSSVTIAESVPFAGQASATQAVPEPGAWVLIGTALLGLLAFRRRH